MTDKKYYEYGRDFPAALEAKKGSLASIRKGADDSHTYIINSGVVTFLKDDIDAKDLPEGFLIQARDDIASAFAMMEQWAQDDKLSIADVKAHSDQVIKKYDAIFKPALMETLKSQRDNLDRIMKFESGLEQAVTEMHQSLRTTPTLVDNINKMLGRADMQALGKVKYSADNDMTILKAINEDISIVLNGTEKDQSGMINAITPDKIKNAWENLATTLQRPEVHGALTQTTIDELRDVLQSLKQRMDDVIFDKHASLPPPPVKEGRALG